MTLFYKILLIVILEILINVIYTIITPKEKKVGLFDYISIIKGLIERGFLTYALISDIPHALTLFGALKLGTRLKSADEEKSEEGKKREAIYNNYYLIGNIISVTLSIFYFNLLK